MNIKDLTKRLVEKIEIHSEKIKDNIEKQKMYGKTKNKKSQSY